MNIQINKQQRKVIFLSSLGGMLDFYDFVIFAVYALPIGKSFFPSNNPLLEMMAAFSAFAIGYLARPLGGILFSHFGDKYGRRQSFILSIIIMGLATFSMGLIPGYHQYGLLMPILFLMLRFIQGIAVGGEIPGAITYVAEHVKQRPGLACGIIFLFLNLGIISAQLFNALLLNLSPYLSVSFEPWRIAFVVGGILAIVSYFLRTSLDESPEFLSFQHQVKKIPLFDLIKNYRAQSILATLIVAVQATLISIIYLYTTSFMQLTKLYSSQEITYFNLNVLVIFCFTNVFSGYLSDILGHRKLLIIGITLLIPSSVMFYHALAINQNLMVQGLLIAIVSGMVTGSFSVVLVNMFPTRVRYSGIALSYNLAFAFFAGLAPLTATSLIERSQNLLMPGILVASVCIISLSAALVSKPTVKPSSNL